MNISIVISLFNEQESLKELINWIKKVMDSKNYSYEIILVDDGSTDSSWQIIEKMVSTKQANIKGIKFRRNYGKSAAIYCGFEAAVGDVVITMDADLQDSPDEIPILYDMIINEDYDMVSGWKKKRYDPISKTIPSKFYNWTAQKVSGIKLNDFNCGLKAYKNIVVKNIEVYGEMHRYIPILAKQAGFTKIGEKVINHQKRKYGVTKFGLERFINGFLDLMTISLISKFGKRPMHFFGTIGSFSFLIGFIILTYLSFAKFFYLQYKMTDRPLFYFGLLSIIFGAQMFLTGFTNELISRNSPERNFYHIEKKIDF